MPWSRLSSGPRVFRIRISTPLDDVVAQLADGLVAEAFVERACPRVERRDAEEDVRRLAKDPLLGEGHQLRAESAAARVGGHADGADVADERAAHVDDDEAAHGSA